MEPIRRSRRTVDIETIRRLIIGLACVAAAAVAPTAASAQGRVELLSTPPAGLRAGQTWKAQLLVKASPQELAASDAPTILLHNEAAGWTKIRASPVPGEPGAYTAAVVFPDSGTWTYHVHDPINGGGYDFDPIAVAAPDGDFPLWLVLGSVVGLACLVAVTRRLQPGDQLRRRHDPGELTIEVRPR